MEVIFLDSTFKEFYILDYFKSLIWTDRYWTAGDVDILVSPTEELMSVLEVSSYLRIKESEHLMILETFGIESDIEEGVSLVIKGSSLESILERRVIPETVTIDGNLQTGIQGLLNDNIISPTDTDRDISNFEFQASSDTAITTLTLTTQFLGESLYKAISDICESNGIGFKVTLTTAGNFRFELYAGKDRSSSQSTNPEVLFSPDFDNLLNGSYVESNSLLKSHIYVAGEEGVGNTRTIVEVAIAGTPPTGLNRREMFYEANINRNTPGGELTEAEYIDQLTGKGVEELAKHIYVKAFDGELTTVQYLFGMDFFMGDILQLADGYDHTSKSRVTEMIYSEDLDGPKMYPTFTTIEE